MTTSTLESRAAERAPLPPSSKSGQPRGRIATLVVLICSLICTAIMKEWATTRRDHVSQTRYAEAPKSSAGNMGTFALALMLGGLRGPLVMYLWPAVENQKANRNLEDVETMIKWIRWLQPEFDSVHMFQMWNKAYNLSAQKANVTNKYADVMDALEYGASVDKERPGDINILFAIQDIYGQKLGNENLPEYSFYSLQFREDSMTPANRKAEAGVFLQKYMYPRDKYNPPVARSDTADSFWAQPLLTDDNRIRPDLLQPTRARPPELGPGAEWNDGSELQYLKQFEPFPYGVSQMAMSYNYAKRAEVALSVEQQRLIQSTNMVVDSHPAITLKVWEEDDSRCARVSEGRAFGIDGGALLARSLMGIRPVAQNVNMDGMRAALYYYDNALHLSQEAIKEYDRHLAKPEYSSRRFETYAPHLAEMNAAIECNTADRDYLQAIVLANAARNAGPYRRPILESLEAVLLESARGHYEQAMLGYERIVLRYFTEDAAIWPRYDGLTPAMPDAPLGIKPDKEAVIVLTNPEDITAEERAHLMGSNPDLPHFMTLSSADAKERARLLKENPKLQYLTTILKADAKERGNLVKGTPGTRGTYEKVMANAARLKDEERDHDRERTDYQTRVHRCQARIELIRPSGIPLLRPADPIGPPPPFQFNPR